MSRPLHVDPSDATPIWAQIEAGVRRLVASGAVAAGAAVPSVRELARELRVNPATVSKGYQRLVDAGVLVVRRGEGTFVAASPPVMNRAERWRELEVAAAKFATVARTLGASRADADEALRAAWQRFEAERKREGR